MKKNIFKILFIAVIAIVTYTNKNSFTNSNADFNLNQLIALADDFDEYLESLVPDWWDENTMGPYPGLPDEGNGSYEYDSGQCSPDQYTGGNIYWIQCEVSNSKYGSCESAEC